MVLWGDGREERVAMPGDVTAEKLKQDLDAGGDLLLLDVRQPEECACGCLPGAVPIPRGELSARMSELDRERDLVVYCHSGRH